MRTKVEILQGENEREFMTSCFLDPIKFFTRVLGFEAKEFHKEWIRTLMREKEIAISAPTGFGKTTVFGIFWPIWMCYYKPKSLVLIISRSIRTQSSTVLEEIKNTIENNEILKQLMSEELKTTWTKEKIIMNNGSETLYSSYSVNVRGLQADYVFADEVATYENQELFFRDVMTRVVSKRGQLAAVSTPLTTSDLLARLMNIPGFYSRVYPAIVNSEGVADLKGSSIWPEKFPVGYLLQKRERIGISNFERNYMCNPKAESAEMPIFTLSAVEDCYDKSLTKSFDSKTEGGIVYIGCDFAISSGPRADFDCYVVVEDINNFVIIRNIERSKGVPTQSKVQRIKELCELYNPVRVIIDESNIGSAVLQELLSNGVPAYPQSFNPQSRKKLLLQLKSIIDNRMLVIPRKVEGDNPMTITNTDILTEELIGMKEEESRITKIKHIVSTSAHDDTVMALAMACSGVIFKQEFQDFIASEDSIPEKKDDNIQEKNIKEIEEEQNPDW